MKIGIGLWFTIYLEQNILDPGLVKTESDLTSLEHFRLNYINTKNVTKLVSLAIYIGKYINCIQKMISYTPLSYFLEF